MPAVRNGKWHGISNALVLISLTILILPKLSDAVCNPGWAGACTTAATCSTACPKNAMCTDTNTCKCLADWLASDATCTTPAVPFMFPASSELSIYSSTNGNGSNYAVSYDTSTYLSPTANVVRLVSHTPSSYVTSTMWSKSPLNGLPNFNINVTVDVDRTGGTSFGFSVEIATGDSNRRLYNGRGLETVINEYYSGFYLRFNTAKNAICANFFQDVYYPNPDCFNGYNFNSYPLLQPSLRQKVEVGVSFLDYKLQSVYMCNVTMCSTIFQNLTGYDLTRLGNKPYYLGLTGAGNPNYDSIDIYDIKVFKKNVCSTSCVYGTCLNSPSTCDCSPGFSGSACDIPDCNPMCTYMGTCVSGTCICSPGWMGATCDTPTNCTFCPEHSFCTGNTPQCTCLAGFSGANCTSRASWMSPVGTELQYFWLNNTNTTNYDLVEPNGIVAPGALRITGWTKRSWVYSNRPLPLLGNFSINVTIEMDRKAEYGEGFSIEIASASGTRRCCKPGYSLLSPSFAGLAAMFLPNLNVICIFYSQEVTGLYNPTCAGSQYSYNASGSLFLRQRMHVGMRFVNNQFTTLYVCTVASCLTVFDGMAFDLSQLLQPFYLGVQGLQYASFTPIDLYEIAVYSSNKCNGVACVYGQCVSNSCVCYPGYTGSLCDTYLCSSTCGYAGVCTNSGTCQCDPGRYGPTCSLVANCTTPCPTYAQCTGNGICTCILGWSGPNCSIPPSWAYPQGILLPQFTFENANLAAYDLYKMTNQWVPMLNTAPTILSDNGLRLQTATPIYAFFYSKASLTGLLNYNINITVNIATDYIIPPYGFAIELASTRGMNKAYIGWNTYVGTTQGNYTGLVVRVAPNFNSICVQYSAANYGAPMNMYCKNVTTKAIVATYPYLSGRMHIGLTVINGTFTTLYLCNVARCSYIFSGLSYDISAIPSPVSIGMSTFNEFSMNAIDLYDIRVYQLQTCNIPCYYGICASGTSSCICQSGYTGPFCNISTCSLSCQNKGLCTGINQCQCAVGWTGVDCSAPICVNACGSGGTCVAPNTCLCSPGWYGNQCLNLATCPAGCAVNSQCVSATNCFCLPGWSGTNCVTGNPQIIFLQGSQVSNYSYNNDGDMSNYDLYVWNTITNPQAIGNTIRLISNTTQQSAIWTKLPLNGLPNFSVNATIQIGNTGTTGDGFSIEIASASSIVRPAPGQNLASRTSPSYAGLMLRVSPSNNAACLTFNAAPGSMNTMCLSLQYAYQIAGHPNLRTKYQIGMTFVNYKLRSVLMCNFTDCKTAIKIPTSANMDVSILPGKYHLGFSGFSSANYDTVDIWNINVFPLNASCVYGNWVNSKCVCSTSYTGPTCSDFYCRWSCNHGSCTGADACTCDAGYTGIDCSMNIQQSYKMAVDYQLLGGTAISSSVVAQSSSCAVLCRNTATCKSANFRLSDKTCFLLSNDYSTVGTTLNCSAGFTHWELDGSLMSGYKPSKQMSCDSMMNNACPKPYQSCQSSCVSNIWTGSCQPKTYTSCLNAYNSGERRTGVYSVNPDGGAAFEVWCEMTEDTLAGGGAGYTVVYRRKDGTVDMFNALNNTLKSLMGDLNNEFWIGADKLARLTATPKELLYLVWPFEPDNQKIYIRYSSFSIGSSATGYQMSASGKSSPFIGADPLRAMTGRQLRAKDWDIGSCATNYGPDWTDNTPCHWTNPFGKYLYGWHSQGAVGMNMYDFMGYSYSYRMMEWRLK